jgi:deoxyribose-phosphate aldolase
VSLHRATPEQIQPILRALSGERAAIDAAGGPDKLTAAVAGLIDHTLLKPEASEDDIRRLCAEGVRHSFATVVVNPIYAALAAECVRSSAVRVCTVAGFPLGAAPTEAKRYEAQLALQAGAAEVDMVISIGAVKSGKYDLVESDVAAVVKACHAAAALCKVILETALLTTEEKQRVCQACLAAGADFVKTSTGFGPSGATPEDVALMRAAVGTRAGVKAAGGIRTLGDVEKMLAAGATRIGCSSSVRILEELRHRMGSASH